ncbi:ATP-dependent nuclease [Streptomyces sp. CS149]|uniref:ATP-dependent nuclease n=1 Tax=Streptomyces sp. CS149 TaxID=2109332 RepID=UPI00131EF716|nr:ATP-binding protein [Streptomyces sp. CS149]
MIKEVKFTSFKAFGNFAMTFKGASLLVGPNSAGKSTILTSLRLAETCLRLAKRTRPNTSNLHAGSYYLSYPVPTRDFAALNESVRHNFRDDETSMELSWRNGCKMRIVWPERRRYEDEPTPFFYLLDANGKPPRTVAPVKANFSTIGVIPTLSPLEHEEPILETETIRKNLSTRLSSRHFRNQMRLLDQAGEWDEFIEFASPWLAGIELGKPVTRYDTSSIDVFFTEAGNGSEKEIVWAGDGVQIWLQLLLHIYRSRDLPTLVLDEPEVFLHADLQRRLVRLLESLETQIVLATHSTEVLTEADPDSIVWVDKTRRRAVRAPKDSNLSGLNTALGSSFNLAMAKALRARGVIFVEGKDVRTLKRLSRTLGLGNISEDISLAVVPMTGYSRWEHAEAFGWFLRNFLGNTVKALVLLDRDYRTDMQVEEVVSRFASVDVHAHVWRKKELESYLIIPETIARLSQSPVREVQDIIDGVMAGMQNKVTSRLLAEKIATERATGRSVATINEDGLNDLTTNWTKSEFRYSICPPKEVMAGVNRELQQRGHKAVAFDTIAKYARASEIHPEMVALLEKVENLAV